MSYVANMPVRQIIADRLPNTLILAGITAVVSVIVALTIGIVSAINRGGRIDRVLNVITLSLVATPEFLVATLGVLIFSVKLLWLPSISLAADGCKLGRDAALTCPAGALADFRRGGADGADDARRGRRSA